MNTPEDTLSKPSELPPGSYIISPMDLEELARLKTTLVHGVQYFLEGLRQAATPTAEALGNLANTLREAGLVAEAPPSDPRERALWARRNRGTGPAVAKAWHKR